MNMIIVVLIFVALATAVFALGTAFLAPASSISSRLQGLLGRPVSAQEKPRLRERVEQVLDPISDIVPKSPEGISETRLWLMQAGYRDDRHMKIYFGLRGLAAMAALALVLVTGWVASAPMMTLVLPALGYILPRFVLKRMITARQENISLALPDALDLMIICVESGLALDQAINRVGLELRQVHPALSDELQMVNLEIRAGKPRAEALRNLAARTGVDDIRAFVAVLIQTGRFGTSVAQALRVHSDALRTERRQRAEERAAKTTIKMIPVLVLFVFPVMFFVVLGPTVIAIIRDVLPAMNKQ